MTSFTIRDPSAYNADIPKIVEKAITLGAASHPDHKFTYGDRLLYDIQRIIYRSLNSGELRELTEAQKDGLAQVIHDTVEEKLLTNKPTISFSYSETFTSRESMIGVPVLAQIVRVGFVLSKKVSDAHTPSYSHESKDTKQDFRNTLSEHIMEYMMEQNRASPVASFVDSSAQSIHSDSLVINTMHQTGKVLHQQGRIPFSSNFKYGSRLEQLISHTIERAARDSRLPLTTSYGYYNLPPEIQDKLSNAVHNVVLEHLLTPDSPPVRYRTEESMPPESAAVLLMPPFIAIGLPSLTISASRRFYSETYMPRYITAEQEQKDAFRQALSNSIHTCFARAARAETMEPMAPIHVEGTPLSRVTRVTEHTPSATERQPAKVEGR